MGNGLQRSDIKARWRWDTVPLRLFSVLELTNLQASFLISYLLCETERLENNLKVSFMLKEKTLYFGT